MATVYFYAFKVLNIDTTVVEENEIYTEAMMLSLLIFVLSWTLTHTFTLWEGNGVYYLIKW